MAGDIDILRHPFHYFHEISRDATESLYREYLVVKKYIHQT